MEKELGLNVSQSEWSLKEALINHPEALLGRNLSSDEITFIATEGESLNLSSIYHSVIGNLQTQRIFPVINKIFLEKINDFFLWIKSLSSYDNVYIFANSESGKSHDRELKRNDLVIIFNGFLRESVITSPCDIAVINRQINATDKFFYYGSKTLSEKTNVKRISMLNSSNAVQCDEDFCHFYDLITICDFVPYSINNKKSPSSGLTLLYIIHEFFKNTASLARIHPIGFEFSDQGWIGHDWELERILKEKMAFNWI